jgi:glycosyltransferase involved in cell wall biosynthesis
MAALLCNEFSIRDRKVVLIITHQKNSDSYLEMIHPKVDVINLEDELRNEKKHVFVPKAIMLYARIVAKVERWLFHKDKDSYSIRKFYSRNYDKILWLKKFFNCHKNAAVISFLYQSIFHTLLSVNKCNNVIISERADPEQCLNSQTNIAFFREMFPKADVMVFQSEGAKECFEKIAKINGKVIYNPVRADLPQPLTETRNKTVVNFCRLAKQKNIHLLIDAFVLFWEQHKDYSLRIIGGWSTDGGQEYIEQVKKHAKDSICPDKILFLPQSLHVHDDVLQDGMFVSSSDYEGMSNSMLEAMAIGLPTICTDCPAGGARAIIIDHENGILTPVGDVQALAAAMVEVADNADLAEKLSENGVKVREQLSTEKIVNQWIELIDN